MVESGNLLDLLAHQNYVGSSSNMLFTRGLHTRIGGFAAFRYVHDWDFALRAMALGRYCYVRRYLTAYRIHARNTIMEDYVAQLAESQAMLDRFLTDFPEVAKRGSFRIGLEQNKAMRHARLVKRFSP
jgi:hypothetical protein